jgi:hypothetical protein
VRFSATFKSSFEQQDCFSQVVSQGGAFSAMELSALNVENLAEFGHIQLLMTGKAANNWNNMDSIVASTMSNIRDRMPAVQWYQHLYNDENQLEHPLQTRLVVTYEKLMKFCMELTKFSSRSGLRQYCPYYNMY